MEQTIKQLEQMLKVRKEQKEIIECAGGTCINCNPDIQALQNAIDGLKKIEKLEKENFELKQREIIHKLEVKPKDNFYEYYDFIPKSVIRDKFKRINETKIKTDKINARNYMIFGDTDRATGWFINVDYIEKILLDVPGYKIGEE